MRISSRHKFFRDRFLVNMTSGESYDIKIDRTTEFGNPLKIGRDGSREEVIDEFFKRLNRNPELMKKVRALRGKRLGCWCYPKLCHGDAYIKIIYEV